MPNRQTIKIIGSLGCLVLSCLNSAAETVYSGNILRKLDTEGKPVVLEYARPTSKGSEKPSITKANSHAVSLAKAPSTGPGVSPVPTFASELSASVMSEELKNKIDDEYVRKLKNFMYFHGYDVTSRDARGRFYNIDPAKELKVRQAMAHSMRSYMLSRGIPKFLMSREDTKQLGETYQEVVDSTHVDVAFGEQKPEDRTPPWRLKTGMNPFALTGYLRVTNEIWVFETKNKLTNYKQMEMVAARKIDNYDLGNRYNLQGHVYTPFVDYAHSQYLKTGLSSTIPVHKEKLINHVYTSVNLEYLF